MIEKQTKFSKNLEKIYKDILDIKIDINDSFKTSLDKFYVVMRKWNICQGKWTKNGRCINNAEWIMCFQVFKNYKLLFLDTWLVLNEPPEDLQAYGKEPKRKKVCSCFKRKREKIKADL